MDVIPQHYYLWAVLDQVAEVNLADFPSPPRKAEPRTHGLPVVEYVLTPVAVHETFLREVRVENRDSALPGMVGETLQGPLQVRRGQVVGNRAEQADGGVISSFDDLAKISHLSPDEGGATPDLSPRDR